jgi:hypothetical protein
MLQAIIIIADTIGTFFPAFALAQGAKMTFHQELSAHGVFIPAWVTTAAIASCLAYLLARIGKPILSSAKPDGAGSFARARERWQSSPDSVKPESSRDRCARRLKQSANIR